MATQQHVFVLSDATGETVEKMVSAALTQFREKSVQLKRISNVRSKNQVYESLDEALAVQALVVYTIVNRELAQLVHDECDSLGILSIDLITPLLMRLSEHFGHSPGETPGLLHEVDEKYFRRIEAVEFTVKHDDGQEVRNLHKADIVLVGVSRTSKTPLSIYLAHRGWKVANIPWSRELPRRRSCFRSMPPGSPVWLSIRSACWNSGRRACAILVRIRAPLTPITKRSRMSCVTPEGFFVASHGWWSMLLARRWKKNRERGSR